MTTARMVSGSRTHTCVPVLIVVVVGLRPAAVFCDQGVSKTIVNFPRCRRNSPRPEAGSSHSSVLPMRMASRPSSHSRLLLC